jgi:hypothetical protein
VKRLLTVLVLALVVALAVVHAPGAGAAARTRPHGKVLVVSYPGLTWDDVVQRHPPVLDALLRRSAVASMSVRTIGPYTSLGEAYATIGAGNRATAEDAFAGQAYPPQAAVEGDLAAEVFARRCGCSASGMAVLQVGMPRVTRSNDRLLYGAEPGALGTALSQAHRRAAVIANADRAIGAVADQVHREAALAAVDEEGRAPLGNVGPALIVEDPTAPYGVRMDVDATADAVSAAWDGADLLVLEMSDLDRADRYSDLTTEQATESARGQALARADVLLDRVLQHVDATRDLVLVVAPTAPRGPAQLTVAAASGPGFRPGQARSATTRRNGFVTLPDIAPTVLDFLGVDIPDAITGTAIVSGGGGVSSHTFASMVDDDEVARFRDRATGPASVTFIVLQVVGYALAALALTRWRRARPWVEWLLLVPLAQAPLAFLSGLVRYDALTVPGYVVIHVVTGAALAGLALVAGRALERRLGAASALVAPLALLVLTLLVLLVDIAVGGPLQLNTVFGYSPTVAGRFAGWGNLTFSLVAAAALIAMSGAWSFASLRAGARAPRRRQRALALVAASLFVVVLADGLPSLGSDVGGVLALVPAGAVLVLLLAGVRLSWTRLVLIVAGTAAVLVTFALVDLSRPEDSRTHLGRLAAKVLHADNGGVATVLHRKVQANVGILTSSVWTWVIPIALAFLSFLLWRRPGSLAAVEERMPGLRAGLVASLIAGIVGFALNDSGIAVPAMMLAVVLPYLAFLLVRTAD